MNKISEQAIAKREQTAEQALPAPVELPPPPPPPAPVRRERAGSIKQIATAIAAITGEIGVVPKLGTNAFHHYKYAAMGDIVVRLNKLMASNGLVIVQSETSRQWVDGGAAISITYEFTIAHSSGEVWPERPQSTGLSRCRDSKGGFDDKSINKCHTAARKYFLISLFQIATGDESDADAGDNEKPRKTITSGKKDYPTPQQQLAKALAHDHAAVAAWEPDKNVPEPEPPQPTLDEDHLIPDPGAETNVIETLEQQARKFASKGELEFNRWYVNRDQTEKRRLIAIGEELRGLINDADLK